MPLKHSVTGEFLLLSLTIAMTTGVYERPPTLADYASAQIVMTLITTKMTWDESTHACKSLLGGTLVRIDSHQKNKAVRDSVGFSWVSDDFRDSWIGLQWRLTEASTSRELVWSDNCDLMDWRRYHLFRAGDDAPDKHHLCYRIKNNFEWEVRSCAEKNSFICETRKFPHPGPLSTDTGSGMMVVSKEASEGCSAVCTRLYGCYRVSDLTNTSCVVDVISDDPSDGVESLYKPPKIDSFLGSLSQTEQDTVIQEVSAMGASSTDTVCKPPPRLVPYSMTSPQDVNVPVMVDSVENCTSTVRLESSSCTLVAPSPSTQIETTTIFHNVTLSPEVSIVPTKVTYTNTVTMTTQLFSSCAPEIITETTTFIVSEQGQGQACSTAVPTNNLTSENLEDAVSSILSELVVDERTTSKSRSRYKSAPDNRVSSRTMGSVALAFICVVLLLLIALDTPTMFLAVKGMVPEDV